MKIFINGKELSATLENEKNAYEVLKPVEEWCNSNSFLINRILIDEKEMSPYIEEEYKNIAIENIKKIDIEALSHSEYYLSSMISIIEYIEKVSKVDSVTLSEKDIEDLKYGIFWILDSVPRAIFLCNMNLETYGVIHILKMLEVKLERLNTLTDNEEYNNYFDKVKEFFQDDFKPFLNDKVLPSMDMVLQDAKINAIIIFASNINENNALYKIGTLPKFQPFIIEILDEVVDKLQTGKDKEAFIYAEKFSHIVGLSFSVLSKVAEICSIDYSNIKIDNISLLDSINDFNSMMNNLLDAFSNEDYISIADLLEYEIKEKIENIMDYTPLLEEYIERLNV
ncbi:hypothetical protein EPJ70_09505 [Brachyspira aalborgi]|uniref:Uncharacterized protein n=1 Tax=Brachyspira aalborgi TaxID=29522 RepID=A0A5C8F4X0_9SPIR|nr:hypothetical protein [Brachyspira aalborgi]TXJ44444.1 hypothetical protein EPJ70_09505 [Brachyspira aalborgi]